MCDVEVDIQRSTICPSDQEHDDYFVPKTGGPAFKQERKEETGLDEAVDEQIGGSVSFDVAGVMIETTNYISAPDDDEHNVTFYCAKCHFASLDSAAMAGHECSPTVKRRVCEICGYKAAHMGKLRLHMRSHTGEKPHECPHCHKMFTRQQHLKRHLRSHSDEKFLCSICDFTCVQPEALKNHMYEHTGGKPYVCFYCDYTTVLLGHLKRHIKIHTGENPFSCTICPYETKTRSDLKNHARTHTGERPYPCPICPHRCTQASSLKNHLSTHSGEKPYSCSQCAFRTKRTGLLKSHLKSHSGEKPFHCPYCDHKCSRREHLKKHVLIHTKK